MIQFTQALIEKLYAFRFIRFGFVGGLGFVVNEAALLFSQHFLHTGPKLGWFVAFLPSVVFTWWGNRKITFTDGCSQTFYGSVLELLRFVASNSVGAVANFVVYSGLTMWAPAPLRVPYVALVVGVLIGMVFNFTLSKKFVFKK